MTGLLLRCLASSIGVCVVAGTMGSNKEAKLDIVQLNMDCVFRILKTASPRALGQAAAVNRAWKQVSDDNSLWETHFVAWSPEPCVSPPLPKGLCAYVGVPGRGEA
jgi:hypothetical protein